MLRQVTPTPLASAIGQQLAEEPRTVGELAKLLGRSQAVIRNTLATMYFDDKSIACDAGGRYSLRSQPSPNGKLRLGYLGEREGDGFV